MFGLVTFVVYVCDVVHYRLMCASCFFFQAEDGIRDLVRSRGLGDVYKRQHRRQRQEVRAPQPRAGPSDVHAPGRSADRQDRLGLSLIHI